MTYYVPLNTAAVRIMDRCNVEAEIVTLKHGSARLLPVFTSFEQFQEFFGKDGDEGGCVNPLATDPFGVAEMVARMEERSEVEALLFDPVRTFGEGWKSNTLPITVGWWLRYIEEIRPGIKRVSSEMTARFGPTPRGSEAFKEAMHWAKPRFEKVGDDACARMAKWDL